MGSGVQRPTTMQCLAEIDVCAVVIQRQAALRSRRRRTLTDRAATEMRLCSAERSDAMPGLISMICEMFEKLENGRRNGERRGAEVGESEVGQIFVCGRPTGENKAGIQASTTSICHRDPHFCKYRDLPPLAALDIFVEAWIHDVIHLKIPSAEFAFPGHSYC